MKRGNALPETALVAGLIFLLLFGTINLAFLGYSQMRADGATFVASRAAAANPASPSAAAAAALTKVFPSLDQSAISIQAVQNGLQQTTYRGTAPGLTFFGLTGTGPINVFSREVENSFNGASSYIPSATGGQYPFSVVTEQLNNHTGTYNVWLAQKLVVTTTGCQNASGSSVATPCYDDTEFQSHCQAYANLAFTAPDAKTLIVAGAKDARQVELPKTSNWNPATSGSKNSVIYGWDTAPHTFATPSSKGTGKGSQGGTC
jgi:hypothetical protein